MAGWGSRNIGLTSRTGSEYLHRRKRLEFFQISQFSVEIAGRFFRQRGAFRRNHSRFRSLRRCLDGDRSSGHFRNLQSFEHGIQIRTFRCPFWSRLRGSFHLGRFHRCEIAILRSIRRQLDVLHHIPKHIRPVRDRRRGGRLRRLRNRLRGSQGGSGQLRRRHGSGSRSESVWVPEQPGPAVAASAPASAWEEQESEQTGLAWASAEEPPSQPFRLWALASSLWLRDSPATLPPRTSGVLFF